MLLKSTLLLALFSVLTLRLRLSSYTMGGMGTEVVIVEEGVLDGMVVLRSAVIRLSQQVFDIHGGYGYIPPTGGSKSAH